MVEKTERIIKIPSIKLNITLDEGFYNDIMEAKVELEKIDNTEYQLGDYIMKIMTTIFDRVDLLEEAYEKQNNIIKLFSGVINPNIENEEVENNPHGMYQ